MMDPLIQSNYTSVEGSWDHVIAFILMKWENATETEAYTVCNWYCNHGK